MSEAGLTKKLEEARSQGRKIMGAIKAQQSVTEAKNPLRLQSYYGTWLQMAVHVACLVRPMQKDELARVMRTHESAIASTVQNLKELGLIKATSKGWMATESDLHLDADHPYAKFNHIGETAQYINFLSLTQQGFTIQPCTHFRVQM